MVKNALSEKFTLYEKAPDCISENLGGEYEILMCTYYSLKLCFDKKVRDFEITTNNKDYGKFDDVVIKVTSHGNTSHTMYLMQLKHQKNVVNITKETLTKTEKINGNRVKRDNLHIIEFVKLCNSVQNVLENKKPENGNNIIYILSTNRSSELSAESQSLEEVLVDKESNKSYVVRDPTVTIKGIQPKHEFGINTNDSETNNASIFHVEKTEKGCKNLDCFFQLFTGQKNCDQIHSEIDTMLVNEFKCKVDFVNFMRHWWKNKYVLTKRDVMVKLAELLLSPFVQEISNNDNKPLSDKEKLLKDAIMEFEPNNVNVPLSDKEEPLKDVIIELEMTLVKDCDDANAVVKIWREEYSKLENTWKNINLNCDVENYCKNETDTEEEKEKKYIINIVLKFGLMNRKPIDKDDLTSKEIMNILWYLNKAPFIVKYDVNEEKRIDAAINLLKTNTGRKKLILLGQIPHEKYSEWNNLDDSRNTALKSKESLSKWTIFESLYDLRTAPLYKEIIALFKVSLQERQSISLEKLINSDTETAKVIKIKDLFLMLEKDLSIGKPLPKRPVPNIPRILKHDTLLKKEEEAISSFNNPVNIVIGKPGIGKSTLMTYLSHKCPPDYWCIRVNLIKYSNFFNEDHSTREIMNEFVKDEDPFFNKVRETFEKQQRMYLFLDGLDEIGINSVKSVLKFVKDISSIGIRVWISAREHLKYKDDFEMSPITIEEPTKKNQKEYIKSRLGNDDAEEYVRSLSTCFPLVSTIENMLGIPLQLFIITEIYPDKTILKNIKTEDIFVITKMYKTFFQGKEKHQQEKALVQYARALGDNLEHTLELYELPALETSASRFLPELQLDGKKMKESQKFLQKIQTEGDQLGIITEVVSEKNKLKAIFSHKSFAEYFACVWLKKNQEKLELIKDSFLKDNNDNLRLIFDIMLSEDKPLNLAVLYKNLNRVKKYIQQSEEKDEEGRTALHLICLHCKKYYTNLSQNEFKTIQELADRCNPLEKDKLFNWDCLEYALHTSNLLPIEALFESRQKQTFGTRIDKITQHFGSFDKLVQKCCYYGCPVILETLIVRLAENKILQVSENLIKRLILGSQNTEANYWINVKYSRIVDILKNSGYDIKGVVDHDENYNALHLASRYGNIYIIKLLYDEGVKIDERDKNGWTPLHHACSCRNFSAVKKILELAPSGHINAVTNENQTILHFLASNKKVKRDQDLVSYLLKNKINMYVKDDKGRTALQCACNAKNYEVIKLLIENNANIVDEASRIILRKNFYEIFYKGREQLVELLLKVLTIEEIASSLTNLPPEFPIDLVKEYGQLQPELLLNMASYLKKKHGNRYSDEESLNFEEEDNDSLSKDIREYFDNLM